jgi:hypothetical protein
LRPSGGCKPSWPMKTSAGPLCHRSSYQSSTSESRPACPSSKDRGF